MGDDIERRAREAGELLAMMKGIAADFIAAERKRLAADIRTALAKHETWTSGPEALEHLAQEIERA